MRSPAPDPPGYSRRCPEDEALYQVVAAHLGDFFEQAEAAGGLPSFVERTLRGYLDCGILAKGFVRVRCPTCRDDMVVAFSCKGRGLCPSCGGRRMADIAAHLVDQVLPIVAVRQCVLTFPHALRVKLAYDAKLRTETLSLFISTVEAFYARAGAGCGAPGGRTGSVTVIQRFGSALNLNLHFHALFLDGVFYRPRPGRPLKFRALPRLTDEEVGEVLGAFRTRLDRLLKRRGLLDDDTTSDEDAPTDAEPIQQLALASAANLSALGPSPTRHSEGSRPQGREQPDAPDAPTTARSRAKAKGRQPAPPPPPLCVRDAGLSLHAATTAPQHRRGGLEALCRYILRPAVTLDRVQWRADGQVEVLLPRPWRDGTTRLLFEPLAFLARLVPLIPAPRTNDVRYHGVFAPNAKWRNEVVALAPGPPPGACSEHPVPPDPVPAQQRREQRRKWSELMRRAFEIDVLTCAACGDRRVVLAVVTCPDGIRSILDHLGLPSEAPQPPAQRAPPEQWLDLP